MNTIEREIADLELALFRRSLPLIAEACERCDSCHRNLLIGERVYEYASGALRCELCRSPELADPDDCRKVRGPAFGHTMRLIDRRAA
jgi:hypothetical protein